MACFAGEHSLELARLALAESCFDEATAQAQTALVLFRDVQDGVGESQALEILGNVCLRQGGYTAAIDHYQRALQIMEEHGGALGARIKSNLGVAHQGLGDVRMAQSLFTEALTAMQQIGDRRQEALLLSNLASTHSSSGEGHEALAVSARALAISREVGDRQLEGSILTSMSMLHCAIGQHEQALSAANEAMKIHRESGDRRAEGMVMGNLGAMLQEQGAHPQAMAHTERAVEIFREIGDRRNEGTCLGSLGSISLDAGLVDSAIVFFQRAIVIHREIQNRRSEGVDLGNLGEALRRSGATAAAEHALRQAISICDDSIPVAAGAFRGSLALVLAHKGQTVEALALVAHGLEHVKADLMEHIKLCVKHAEVHLLAGEHSEAQRVLSSTQALADRHGLGERTEGRRALDALWVRMQTAGLASSD